jgi:hypothetical protein
MAFLGETYDANEMPQGNSNYDPLPAGWYDATVTQCELKDTTSGTGQYIKIRYDITGPSHEGRVVFGNLNIKNASPKAEEIGRQQLGELMRAIGLAKVTDTDQLIGGQLQIKLDIRPSRTDATTGKTYDAQNEVKGFKALSGSVPKAAPAPAAKEAAAPAAAPGKAAPPWAKK